VIDGPTYWIDSNLDKFVGWWRDEYEHITMFPWNKEEPVGTLSIDEWRGLGFSLMGEKTRLMELKEMNPDFAEGIMRGLPE